MTTITIGIFLCSLGFFTINNTNAFKTGWHASVMLYNLLYWALPTTLTMMLAGIAVIPAVVCGFALYTGSLIPYTGAAEFNKNSNIATDLINLVIRCFMMLLPVICIGIFYGLCWPFILACVIFVPFVYLTASIGPFKNNTQIGDLVAGGLISASLVMSVKFGGML